MVAIYCSVEGCWGSKESKHRFPNPDKDEQRFLEWLKRCGNKNLQLMYHKKVYNNCRICRKHFVKDDLSFNGKLSNTALPILFLPVTIIKEEGVYESSDVSIKKEKADETEYDFVTIDIKEEERPEIYFDELVRVKQEEKNLITDEEGSKNYVGSQ